MEYDRNAAKRTTVIDDQSDFFEIDTNAWLTDQVGGQAHTFPLQPQHATGNTRPHRSCGTHRERGAAVSLRRQKSL